MDPQESRARAAEEAGLRYVADGEPGVRRVKRGRGFSYVDVAGLKVTTEVRVRCETLVIPPAWTDVWICADPDGHIQATGRDAKGRKQYRYHASWNELRQMVKYDRLREFGLALPDLRARVDADLARPGLPREKVLATVVSLMGRTMIRVGNAEYARDNESFGLTTLRGDHVEVEGSQVRFCFRGKSGKMRELDLADRRIARIVRKCQELRGQELFAYLEGGAVRDVRSEDVNAYLRQVTGRDFTSKEFRTWGASVRVFRSLREIGPAPSHRARRKAVLAAVREAAAHLGNTPTVCRKFYVHPVVLGAYEDGRLFRIPVPDEPSGGLGRSEHGLMHLLEDPAGALPADLGGLTREAA